MTLTVYVSGGCWVCDGVAEVLATVGERMPELAVRIVDIDRVPPGEVPDMIFSVPTYALDGVVVSLGNPSAEFVDRLRARLDNSGMREECVR